MPLFKDILIRFCHIFNFYRTAMVKNKANNEIRFAIEDKYLRVALNAKLRECDYFAKF